MLAAALAIPVLLGGVTAQIGAVEGRTLGELVTVSLARHREFDVLSSADVRRVVELEANKATIGCNDAGSCLAEIAGAMGARYVVFGYLATLGEQRVLTLNLFDSSLGSSSGRVVLLGTRVEDLTSQIDGRVDELVGSALRTAAADATRVRVLVLDLETAQPTPAGAHPAGANPAGANASSTSTPTPAQQTQTRATPGTGGPDGLLLVGGGITLAAGLGTAAVGGFFGLGAQQADERARAADLQVNRAAALVGRDANALVANILYASGALLAVAGAVVGGAAFVVGDGP